MSQSKQTQTKTQRTILFRCLASSNRRHVLSCLKDAETPMALADLAEDVAEMEADTPLSEIDPETVKTVYVNLYHCHIPKLEDADLVQYDQERDTVAPAESFGAVDFTAMPKIAP